MSEGGDSWWGLPIYNEGGDGDCPGQLMVEVALTDDQLSAYGSRLAKGLKKLGFKRTNRFLNPNSGNYVTQFVHARHTLKDCPYKW